VGDARKESERLSDCSATAIQQYSHSMGSFYRTFRFSYLFLLIDFVVDQSVNHFISYDVPILPIWETTERIFANGVK